HLDAKGITYEWETDELGIRFPEPVEDDEESWTVIDEFFTDKYGDFDDLDDLDDPSIDPAAAPAGG
ncbi:MAG: hypothetical protein GY925_22685, partial [Actinomycetia bacterium]|nr:hypothetical protein [Actinomycetes bacterium]